MEAEELVDGPPVPVHERYFTKYYHTPQGLNGSVEDQCVLRHSNRICVTCIAPSHTLLAEKGIRMTAINFNKLASNNVSGKRKKGGFSLSPQSVLCSITCEDGRVFKLRSCVKGTLVEINDGLVTNPDLLRNSPLGDGYVAILLPKLEEAETSSGSHPPSEVLQKLHECLAAPPDITTLRVNTLKYKVEDAVELISKILACQYSSKSLLAPKVTVHPLVSDALVIPNYGPRDNLPVEKSVVVVDVHCGIAVMRGADVFAPGVLCVPRGLQCGDTVSVFSDVSGKCLKGSTEYIGEVLHVGNGVARISRQDLFGPNPTVRGVAIEMTFSKYVAPAFTDEMRVVAFPQNLPSIIVSHVLNPQPGEIVLDMCAAPGGKTTHIALLMKDQGCIIALDKSRKNFEKLKDNISSHGLSIVQCFRADATKSFKPDAPMLCSLEVQAPPYSQYTFDRILVDAPCSGLGQRPQLVWDMTVQQLESYPTYQRKILVQAAHLLKPGGVLVYSTCTVSPEENEAQVTWFLEKFLEFELVKQEPFVGYTGLGCNMDSVQRFWPSNFCKYIGLIDKPLTDSLGFFIAKFVKKST